MQNKTRQQIIVEQKIKQALINRKIVHMNAALKEEFNAITPGY